MLLRGLSFIGLEAALITLLLFKTVLERRRAQAVHYIRRRKSGIAIYN